MAKFCPECGSPVQPTQKFCSECGRAVSASAGPIASPSQAGRFAEEAAPHTISPKTPSRLPRILALGGTALVIIVLVMAGIGFYLSHRVNKTAEQANQSLSVPALPVLPTLSQNPAPRPDDQAPVQAPTKNPALGPPQVPAQPTAQSPAPAAVPIIARHVTAHDGQCGLFTKAELTQVLGVTFTHATEDATGCTYNGDQPREWVRVEVLWTGGRNALQQRATAYETLTKSNPKGWIPPFQPVPGLGDQAFVNLVNAIQVRKGDVAVTLDLRYFHDLPDPKALVPDSTRLLVSRALARL